MAEREGDTDATTGTPEERQGAARKTIERAVIEAMRWGPSEDGPSYFETKTAVLEQIVQFVSLTHPAEQAVTKTSDYVQGDDGFWMFWPKTNKGAYSASVLRNIADKLDHDNAEWQSHLEAALAQEKGR